VATHVRVDLADGGKVIGWAGGLGGRPVDSLPLYGSENVAAWALAAWIVVTEGEKDCDALTRCNVPALGTVTGATRRADGTHVAPTVEAVGPVAEGRRFVLWPDNDDAGRGHMSTLAANLYHAGADDVRVIAYAPTSPPATWPSGAGAADLVGDLPPALGSDLALWLIEDWSLPVGRPGPVAEVPRTSPRRSVPRDTGSVSAALFAAYGIPVARVPRNVRCPMHDDRHASLFILRDDLRAICKSGSCLWSGRGVIAVDVLAGVRA
jgi:hypothetical protein